MQTIRSTVYIPLPELTHQSSKLLEVYAENKLILDDDAEKKKANDKGWDPIAAPLIPTGLYKEGLDAVTFIRKIGLKLPLWAVYQRGKKYAWLNNQRLYVANNNFKNCEGNSAQLGVAIALLLNASNSPVHHAIATGCLDGEKLAAYDVAIGAVGSVPEKLDFILQKRQDGTLYEKHLYCFTPKYYQTEDGLYPVASLPQIKQLAALNIEVIPIEWLSEAQALLNARKARYLKQDKWIAAIAGVFTSLLLVLFSYQSWLHNPIPYKMLPGKALAEPFLVCTNQDNSEVSYHDLKHDGNVPLFPVFTKENKDHNVSIGWKLQPEKTLFSDRYYVGYINLGNKAGFKAKFSANEAPMTMTANNTFKQQWQMEENSLAEDNIFMLVFQRTPINANKLNQAFYEKFPEWEVAPSKVGDNPKPPLNIEKARDFLADQFPNHYVFPYKSIISDPPCINSSF